MYITQPALSRHVAEMEKELGVKLLERNKHSVSFTEAGLKVYKQLRKIIQVYDNMTHELSEYQNGVTGRLKLGMLYYTIHQDKILPVGWTPEICTIPGNGQSI